MGGMFMKLTEDLKNKIDGAKSEEEVKSILAETKQNVEDAGVILDDAELDQISGGVVDGIDEVSMSESFREFRK
jgi:hypothetical protein